MKDIQPKFRKWYGGLRQDERTNIVMAWGNSKANLTLDQYIRTRWAKLFPSLAERNIHSLGITPSIIAEKVFWAVSTDDRALDPLNAKQCENLAAKVISWLCEQAELRYANQAGFHKSLHKRGGCDQQTVLTEHMTKWCKNQLEYLKKEGKL